MDFQERTRDELRQICRDKGITGYSRMNKQQLVEALESSLADDLAELSDQVDDNYNDDQASETNQIPANEEDNTPKITVTRTAKTNFYEWQPDVTIQQLVTRIRQQTNITEDEQVYLNDVPTSQSSQYVLRPGDRIGFVAPAGRNA